LHFTGIAINSLDVFFKDHFMLAPKKSNTLKGGKPCLWFCSDQTAARAAEGLLKMENRSTKLRHISRIYEKNWKSVKIVIVDNMEGGGYQKEQGASAPAGEEKETLWRYSTVCCPTHPRQNNDNSPQLTPAGGGIGSAAQGQKSGGGGGPWPQSSRGGDKVAAGLEGRPGGSKIASLIPQL
jgi:hypothetical protein